MGKTIQQHGSGGVCRLIYDEMARAVARRVVFWTMSAGGG